ncbi:DEAD/DEAH box helicase [Stenotrophomonas sp. TWI587]|uniref:DEAD/DEAH box helicase n=1 Tax=Stenotrophomonas sp. TWI587 TaxID=3136783 RepID=UPI00320919D8
MGLFYKIGDAETIYSLIMKSVGSANTTTSGDILTPVQASVRNAINANKYVSISAPTSAGKSYAIRDYLVEGNGDAVIVVPSRALIAEYISSLREQFSEQRDVMIMPFVDSIFTDRIRRRVFVLTPERAREVVSKKRSLDVNLFFFDEAHVSEEEGRGVVFDLLFAGSSGSSQRQNSCSRIRSWKIHLLSYTSMESIDIHRTPRRTAMAPSAKFSSTDIKMVTITISRHSKTRVTCRRIR